MSTVTTKYNLNDSVYIVNYASAYIYKCTVTNIEITTVAGALKPLYRLHVVMLDKDLKNVTEPEIYTFAEAKTVLLAYLNNKITEITNLVEY